MKLARVLFTFSLVVSTASVASADTIQVALLAVTPVGSFFDWTYRAELTSNAQIDGSSIPAAQRNIARFVIYDFGGFQSLVSAPAAWGFITSLAGPIPFAQAPTDNPVVTNVVFTYLAASNPTISTFNDAAAVILGNFTVRSSADFTSAVIGNYSSEDTRDILAGPGELPAPGGHTSSVLVPNPQEPSAPIPEPTTVTLLGTGLASLFLRARKRTRN